jgi:hypothetical protein
MIESFELVTLVVALYLVGMAPVGATLQPRPRDGATSSPRRLFRYALVTRDELSRLAHRRICDP